MPDEAISVPVALFGWGAAGVLTNGMLVDRFPDLFEARAEAVPTRLRGRWARTVRFADPYHWAGFIYLGA